MVTVSELVTGKSLKGRGPVESRLDESKTNATGDDVTNCAPKPPVLIMMLSTRSPDPSGTK